MIQWEYKVVPTPRRPKKAKGVKGNSDRFAFALTEAINAEAAGGWEFVKTETLPMEAKPSMFKSRVEVFQSLMVFRRPVAGTEAGEEALPPMPAGLIAPVAAPTEAPLTAERYVPPSGEETPVVATEAPEEVEEPPVSIGAPDVPVEPAQDVENDGQKAEVEFDAQNIDPLKRVVEANRTRS